MLGWADTDVVFEAGEINFAIARDGTLKKVERNPCRAQFYPVFAQAHAGFEQVREKVYWGNLLWYRLQDKD